MYISTILLIANLIFLFFKGSPLLNWWLFLIFYPAEIIVYMVFSGGLFKIFDYLEER